MRKFLALTVCSVSLFACSLKPFSEVEQREAPNRPPTIPERVTAFSTEYGTLTISTFNVFLNPEFKTYGESVAYFKQLTQFKKQIASLQKQADALLANVQVEKTKFQDLNCIELAESYNEIEETVSVWKQVTEPTEVSRLNNCQSSQEKRKDLAAKQADFSNQVISKQEELRKFADPGYPAAPTLAKLLAEGVDASKIKIKEDGRVDVTLNGFLFEENNQSTSKSKNTIEDGQITQAVYLRDKQVLTFMVPELKMVDEELVKTGSVFLFQMGRAEDSYGSAMFSGKLKLIAPNGSIREGRAIISGKLN